MPESEQEPLRWDDPDLHWDDPRLFWDGFKPASMRNKVMTNDNRISAEISAEVKQQVIDKIHEIRYALNFLVNFQAGERSELPKIGDKTIAFDQKCASYMAARPELVPGFVDQAELAKDRKLMLDLNDIERELSMLFNSVIDTKSLAGHEAYMADLAYYQNIRQAAKRGVNGTEVIYDDLRQRFPGRPGAAEKPAKPA